jgi:hypothetical protein
VTVAGERTDRGGVEGIGGRGVTDVRRLGHLVAAALIGAAMAPAPALAEAAGSPPDWSLLVVTAGPHGASHVRLTNQVTGRQTGAEPMLIADLGATRRPGQPSSAFGVGLQLDSGPDQLNVAGPLGHQHVALASSGPGQITLGADGQAGNLVAGERLAWLFILSGGSITHSHMGAVARSGALRVQRIYGGGAQGIFLADGRDAGPALDAGVADAGLSTHTATGSAGVVGSLVIFNFAQNAGVDVASWTAPDKTSGSVSWDAIPGGGCGSGDPAFAGGAGQWQWTWKGASQQQGELGLAVWAPVGAYWRAFRTAPGGNGGFCVPPVGIPVAHAATLLGH